MSVFKSMTGYGRASLESGGVELTVEILSVNRKHLDINIVLPRHFAQFDPSIRKKIANYVFRGHLTLRMTAFFTKDSPLHIKPNLRLAKELKDAWETIAKELGVAAEQAFSLSLLQKEAELFNYQENLAELEKYEPLILQVIDAALKPFLEMRAVEGQVLQKDITARLKHLKHYVDFIAGRAESASEHYRIKLLEKLKGVLPANLEVDDRVLKEIALYAERIDIAEEILRFNSHLDQFLQLMNSSQEAAGKTAEFLLQELSREINTMGSKSPDKEVIATVVNAKAELERIREQIQNVE